MTANHFDDELVELPKGMEIGELLPTFAQMRGEVVIGKPNRECAACRKPFSTLRKPKAAMTLYPPESIVPVCIRYYVCRACYRIHQSGDAAAFRAAIAAYHRNEEARQ